MFTHYSGNLTSQTVPHLSFFSLADTLPPQRAEVGDWEIDDDPYDAESTSAQVNPAHGDHATCPRLTRAILDVLPSQHGAATTPWR